jgi:hypothetical protein
VVADRDLGAQVRDLDCQLLAVLEEYLWHFLGDACTRVREADLEGLNLGEVLTVHEKPETTATRLSRSLLGLFLCTPDLFFISLLDFLWWQVIWVLFNRLVGFEEAVFLSLVGELRRVVKECDTLDLVIKEAELLGSDPFLVVEGQLYLDGIVADLVKLLGRDFDAVEEPSEWRHDALHALELPVPLGSHDTLIRLTALLSGSHVLVHQELDSLDRRIVEAFAHDVDHGSSIRGAKGRVDLFNVDIIVAELEWLACKLLAIESHVHVELEALLIGSML